MNFHEIRFPSALSFGSLGGPMRRTDIVTLNSGHEERNSSWAQSRRRYDAGVGMRNLDDLYQLIAFFEARHARLYGFRWKDWADFKSCAPSQDIAGDDQTLMIADGQTTDVQVIKTYQSGEQAYERVIHKLVADSLIVQVDGMAQYVGTDYTVDENSGLISFLNPPLQSAKITAGYEFDVPVRFDTDQLEITAAGIEYGDIPNIPVLELRL